MGYSSQVVLASPDELKGLSSKHSMWMTGPSDRLSVECLL